MQVSVKPSKKCSTMMTIDASFQLKYVIAPIRINDLIPFVLVRADTLSLM